MTPREPTENYPAIRAKAVETGAIEECDVHPVYFMTALDEALERRLYAIAAKMHQEGEVRGTLQEVRDTVKAVLEDTGIDCAECERVAAA